MEINADFGRRMALHADRLPWTPFPTPGVERRMLDRVGGEVACATSIVRYPPGSNFPCHVHGGGEEFLVLEGVFSDENRDMPQGTYVRNPPGSAHSPRSAEGCTIFVKLWQFQPDDDIAVRLAAEEIAFTPDGSRPGVHVALLHKHPDELVRLERWEPGQVVELDLRHEGEFLVLDGTFVESNERFRRQSWLRLPPGALLHAQAGPDGCCVWAKTQHLARVREQTCFAV